MKDTALSRTSTAALWGLIFTACAILCRRAYVEARKRCKAARVWLQSRHDFSDDDEPVTLTGWQYLCFALACVFACLVLSIEL